MKKKLLALALTCGLALTSLPAFAAAENIIIDGTTVEIPADMGSVKEKDNRTFVPVRFVSEYLNHTVKYSSTKVNGVPQESVTVTAADGTSYLMVRGDAQLYILRTVNGSAITMDTAAYIDDTEDRFYVPIRFLAEAMGYTIGWDEATQTVTMTHAAE